MTQFYLLSLIFGLLVLYSINKRRALVKKYKSILYPKSAALDEKITDIENTLEKGDKVLYYLRLFDENIAYKILLAFVFFVAIYFIQAISGGVQRSTLGLIGILLILIFILAPSYLRKFIIERRIVSIDENLPIFVDLLAVCVQAGMSIENAIKYLEPNIATINAPFSPFLKKLLSRIEISGLDAGLAHLQIELPSRPISMMCQTLRQSIKYGSQVYDVLMSLSAEIRESSLIQTEENIGKISAKLSIPLILFFMFPVIVVIAAPGVVRVLEGVL